MSDSLLQDIQKMQFEDRSAAEALLLEFISGTFPLDIISVELRPLAISLNSFNGFVTLQNGTKLFFKTHTESDNVIGEYYQAATLAQAGYSVIQPIYSSTEAGKHLLIYEVIDDPSVFDVAWEIESGNPEKFDSLTKAQQHSDDELFTLYKDTLQLQSADECANAPIHQLFHHRLTKGRLERFYGALPGEKGDSPSIQLPIGKFSMHDVRKMKWTINGQVYSESIDDIIERAITLLNPVQSGPSIIGHGDAHNGNVFLRQLHDAIPSLLYFDPAFAGRHHPLLDLTKPLFHNVFAMWMYFPQEKAQYLELSATLTGDHIYIEHNYQLPPLRHMFLKSKVRRTLVPTLQLLSASNQLRDDWRTYLKSALFCCPLLTMNLADDNRFPPSIALLGLAMAMEMGSDSSVKRSVIDQIFDEVPL